MNKLPKRKTIRIKDYDYSNPGAYFITICTAKREMLFWNNVGADIIRPQNIQLSRIGKIAEQGILQIETHYENVFVDKYCIMPDHVHLILQIKANENGQKLSNTTIPTIIGSLKRWVSKQVGKPLWQKSFFDHGLRNQQDYDEIWKYIDDNPLKYILEKAP